MKRSAFAGATGSVCAALAAPVTAQTTTPFVIGSLAGGSDASIYYALQEGWFKASGLDVTIQPTTAGPAAMAGVVGGSMQTADGNVLSLAQAYTKGIPIVLIAAGASWTAALPTSVSLVAGPAIQSLKDLIGGTIAVPSLQDLLTVSTKGLLDKAGIDPNGVHFIEMPPANMPTALQAQRVSAIAVYDPFRSSALSNGGHTIGTPYVSIAPSFLVTAFFAYRTWAEAHRREVAAFQSVYTRGAAYANVHHDELMPMISSFSHIPLEALQRSTYAPVPAAGLDPALIQPVIDAAARYRVIPQAFPAKNFIF
jgi:NitT/TauT family transport system substrate-binding protein